MTPPSPPVSTGTTMTDVVRISSERTLEVAGRNFPAHFTVQDIDDPIVFRVRRARVLFEGVQVSVAWGTGTYSCNHNHALDGVAFEEEPHIVEVGLWPDDALEVFAYVAASDLRDLLEFVAGGGTIEAAVDVWRQAGKAMG